MPIRSKIKIAVGKNLNEQITVFQNVFHFNKEHF